MADKEKIHKDIINYLAVLIKTTQLHHINNISVMNTIEKLLSFINPLLEEDEVTLELVGEFFHIDGTRIRYSMDYIFNYDFLIREFKSKGLGTIVFKNTLQKEDLQALITALMNVGVSETSFEKLSEAVQEIKNLSIKKLRRVQDDFTELDRKKIVKNTYFNAITLTKSVSDRIGSGEKISLKRAKRVMGTIVNQIIEEESMLIGMTTIKDYDEYTYHHSVNVSILSIALGHRLGLSKKSLTEIGLSALLHDIGKIDVPKEILNKPVEFTDEDWETIMKHPSWGAHAILKMKGLDIASMGPFIAAFEHHLNYDHSGYPKIKNKQNLDFFSKIIAIADQYDAMTSSRVYSRIPIAPDRALSIMVDRSGTQLDPYLIKVFINMVGVYPLGSLIMLDTKELGLIFDSNTNPDFSDRPRVFILVNNKGKRIKQMADLMEKNNDGTFKRTIVKTMDPNQYKINLAEYLL